ncbi:MAG TPA: LysE family translocator [Steroidobacteraceae bacterium]|nr:LysE family translocator [Steroidobacteraceae bacterium]
MMPANELLLFALASFIMVLTPGPNMIYLVSRSLCQGRNAAVISLFGVATGFLLHMFAAAAGLTAMFMAIPLAYEILKWLGAAYLLWLAWQAVRPGARSSPFDARTLPADSPARLFVMGFFTNALNPKIAVFYLAVFPQFIRPEHGSVLAQSVQLGVVQIAISFSVNLALILSAARLAAWFAKNPLWLGVQRWLMSLVLAGLAVRLALESRRN